MPLVVPAEELALLLADAGEEEQVPAARLNLDDLELDRALVAREADVEVLATTVAADVEPRLSAPWLLRHLEPSANGGEAPLERLARHGAFLSSCR